MREKRNEERRWRNVYRDAVLFVAAMPLVAGCSGYPGSSSYLAPYYDAAPPVGRMAFRPNQVLAPAPQRTAPVAQEGNSGIGGELLAGAGGFIAGQMLKSGSAGAAGAGEAEAVGTSTGRMIGWEALASESAVGTVSAEEAAAVGTDAALGAAAAGATRTAALGAGETAGVARTAVLGAEETAVAARTAALGAGEAVGAGRAVGIARAAVGVGGILAAGAAAEAGEVLVGAAVIAGSAYLTYKIINSYMDEHSKK
jgi:hypothetical protein